MGGFVAKLEITNLKNGDSVTYLTLVSGVIKGRGKKKVVQVYVQADDSKWYLQRKSFVFGKKFYTPCVFGPLLSSNNSGYNVVAVLSSDRPHSPVDALPADVVKSEEVKVYR